MKAFLAAAVLFVLAAPVYAAPQTQGSTQIPQLGGQGGSPVTQQHLQMHKARIQMLQQALSR